MYINRNFFIFLLIYIANLISCKITGFDVNDSNLIVGSIGFKRLSQLTELCEVNNDFLFRTNDVQLRMNLEIFECLSKIKLNGTLKTTTLTSLSVKQWILWQVDRFNLKEDVNWIPGVLATCGNSTDAFLGGPWLVIIIIIFLSNLGAGSVKRIYNHIPTHTQVKVTGRVHFFDQWNGESVYLKVNNQIVWTESHNWCPTVTDSVCRSFGIDVCGMEYPDRLSVYFEASFQHSMNSLLLEFVSTLPKGTNPCDASWGIDDIALLIL